MNCRKCGACCIGFDGSLTSSKGEQDKLLILFEEPNVLSGEPTRLLDWSVDIENGSRAFFFHPKTGEEYGSFCPFLRFENDARCALEKKSLKLGMCKAQMPMKTMCDGIAKPLSVRNIIRPVNLVCNHCGKPINQVSVLCGNCQSPIYWTQERRAKLLSKIVGNGFLFSLDSIHAADLRRQTIEKFKKQSGHQKSGDSEDEKNVDD